MMPDPDGLSAREARVMATVMARIAQAPPPYLGTAQSSDLLALWRPALAAAAVIAVASAWSLTRRLDAPVTVIQALGLPAPVTRWVEGGDPGPMLMMRGSGGVR